MLVTDKLSIPKEQGSSPNSSCRNNYLRVTNKEKRIRLILISNSPKITASYQGCYYFIITCRMQCNNNRKHQESRLKCIYLHKVNNKGHCWAKPSVFYKLWSTLKWTHFSSRNKIYVSIPNLPWQCWQDTPPSPNCFLLPRSMPRGTKPASASASPHTGKMYSVHQAMVIETR